MDKGKLIDFRKDEQAYQTLLDLIKKSNAENASNVSCEYKGVTITVFTNGIVTEEQFKILDIVRNKGAVNGKLKVLVIDNSNYVEMGLDNDDLFPLSELTAISVITQKESRYTMSPLLSSLYSIDFDGTVEGEITSSII